MLIHDEERLIFYIQRSSVQTISPSKCLQEIQIEKRQKGRLETEKGRYRGDEVRFISCIILIDCQHITHLLIYIQLSNDHQNELYRDANSCNGTQNGITHC